MVFDDYDKKNWERVSGIMFRGTAEAVKKGEEYMYAYEFLKKKYPEYREDSWEESEILMIAITPKSVYKWG